MKRAIYYATITVCKIVTQNFCSENERKLKKVFNFLPSDEVALFKKTAIGSFLRRFLNKFLGFFRQEKKFYVILTTTKNIE